MSIKRNTKQERVDLGTQLGRKDERVGPEAARREELLNRYRFWFKDGKNVISVLKPKP